MNKTLGERLKERMKEVGMKQPELAKRSGVSQPTISQIINGRNTNSRYVAQIASALRCSTQWLATGRGSKDVEFGPPMEVMTTINVEGAQEEMLLHLFRGLFGEQRRDLIIELLALFDANNYTREQLGVKVLKGVSNAEVRAAFGDIPVPHRALRKSTQRPHQKHPGDPDVE